MKLQLDTTNKTITLREFVNLGELIETLDKLLPDDAWKEFTIQAKQDIVWANPIIIDRWNPYQFPWW